MKLGISRQRAAARYALIAAVCLAAATIAPSAHAAITSGVISAGESASFSFFGADSGGTASGTMALSVSADGKLITAVVNNTSGASQTSFISGFGFNTEPDFFKSSQNPDPYDFYLIAADKDGNQILLGTDAFAKNVTAATPFSGPLTNLGKWGLAYDADHHAFGLDTDAVSAPQNPGAPRGLFDPDRAGQNYYTTATLYLQFKGTAGFSTTDDSEGILYRYDPLQPLLSGQDPASSPVLRFQGVGTSDDSLKLGSTTDNPEGGDLPAVPEPASLAAWSILLGCGLVSAGRGRRK